MPGGVPPTLHLTTAEAAAQITRGGFHWDSGGDPLVLTYAFRASIPAGYVSTKKHAEGSTFQALTDQEQAGVHLALRAWSDVANISFAYVDTPGPTPLDPPTPTSNDATLLFGTYQAKDGAGAFAFPPGSTGDPAPEGFAAKDGDVWLNRDSFDTGEASVGTWEFYTLLHEIGHALGLLHPGDYNASKGTKITYENNAEYVEDTGQYSVMSYFFPKPYAQTPLLHDIAALQLLYGANLGTRTGNTTYGFNSSFDAATDPMAGVYDFSVNAAPHLAIWDAGGIDTLDLSGFKQYQVIDLVPEHFSSVGGLTNNLAVAAAVTDGTGAVVNYIENAVGGSGIDLMQGNAAANFLDGGNGADTIFGLDEADTLVGGNDADSLFAGEGNDFANGGKGGDRLLGEAGADTLFGGADDDTLDGGSENDVLQGGLGADALIGGTGFDIADYLPSRNAVVVDLLLGGSLGEAAGDSYIGVEAVNGSVLADQITGDGTANLLRGGSGNDTVDGGVGADSLDGGGGNDLLFADDGDSLTGGTGFDRVFAAPATAALGFHATLAGGSGIEWIQGDAGNDSISAAALTKALTVGGLGGNDSLVAGSSNDYVFGSEGDDTLRGGPGRDTLTGDAGNDRLYADSGDEVHGGIGQDSVYADVSTVATGFVLFLGPGAEIEIVDSQDGIDLIDASVLLTPISINAAAGNDTVLCGAGDDGVFGLEGNDSIDGGGGFDQLLGGNGADTIRGGGGPANPPFGDWLYGEAGNDSLAGSGYGQVLGGDGNDSMTGGFADLMMGGAGDDLMLAAAGANRLIGGTGNDTITGGADADLFDVGDGWGADRVTDFQDGIDRVRMADVTGLDSLAQLAITTGAEGAVIAFAGNTILLVGVLVAQLGATDFVL